MKSFNKIFFVFAVIFTAIGMSAFSFPHNLSANNLSDNKASKNGDVEIFKGKALNQNLKGNVNTKLEKSDFPACCQITTLIDEDFDLWIKGTNEIPDSEQVDDNDIQDLMKNPGDWLFFQIQQAGKAAYIGFDEIGGDGPGYITTPSFNTEDSKSIFRLKVRAMNVNENSQDQYLQVFFYKNANTSMVGASAQPLVYKEWVECEWIETVKEADLRAMITAWDGEVLIDQITVELISYPLEAPEITSVEMEDLDQVKVEWNPVDNATSYKIELYKSTLGSEVEEFMTSQTVGDLTNVILTTNEIIEPTRYTVYITAYNGDDCSYAAYKAIDLKPSAIGSTEAKPATNITNEGFTANWEKAKFASNYLIYPAVNYTNIDDTQTFMLLEDNFETIPLENDAFHAIVISDALGQRANINRYMSVAGWTTDVCLFRRESPDKPLLLITNAYEIFGMGLKGYIMSPSYNLSVGEGEVTVSGTVETTTSDAILSIALVDSDSKTPYSTEEIEVSPNSQSFEITLSGGKENSSVMFWISDAEGIEYVGFSELNISVNLNKGEAIYAPLPTVITDSTSSYDFDYPVNDDNTYTYSVQGFYYDMYGEVSNVIDVVPQQSSITNISSLNYSVKVEGGILHINNPENQLVNVYNIDGRSIIRSNDALIQLENVKGILLVRIDNQIFKVIL